MKTPISIISIFLAMVLGTSYRLKQHENKTYFLQNRADMPTQRLKVLKLTFKRQLSKTPITDGFSIPASTCNLY